MTVLMVPPLEDEPYPTLGVAVADWIEDNLVFGPGDLRGEPARLDAEKRALLCRIYEIFPRGHEQAGRRRFKRCAISVRKGWAKTEMAAWIAAAELHPDAPVRCIGWDKKGNPIGGGVTDPYIPLVAYTEEQSDELAYGALKVILEHSEIAKDFDIGIERIMRRNGDGKAVSLATAPSARDGARTTFSVADEPLSLDTPVPTPDGWRTIGNIQPSDAVFGRDGRVCTVIDMSPVHRERDCFEIKFADGITITADAGHRWLVYDHSPNYKCERVVTTQFMHDHQWRKGHRFRIADADPLDLPDAKLPIDPYVLGLWLGDGDSTNATISVGHGDVDEVEANIKAVGYTVTRCAVQEKAPRLYVSYRDARRSGWGAVQGAPDNHSFKGDLKTLGLLGNKHIPIVYQRASIQQRLALLQGIMDADGFAYRQGHCQFSNSNLCLIRDVRELLYSLRYSSRTTCQADTRWSTPKTQYKLHFTARADYPPFRLRRKRSRLILSSAPQDKYRSIVGVTRVDSVPVRCLEVNSPDHLFLVGENMVPTHNTHHWTLPRLRQAHRTMMANIPKRKMSDAWSLEITTAPAPGEGSVAEDAMDYARQIADGRIADGNFFFFHRQAGDGHDMETPEGIRAAVIEASGPVAVWSDIEAIVSQWADPTADRSYLERVWLNRLVRASDRAFDTEQWKSLANPSVTVPDGARITIGFDGARYNDATALVATHIASGHQWVLGVWEHPHGIENWEVPEREVEQVVAAAFQRWQVWRMYADPPYWETHVSKWAGQYGEKRVIAWRTNRTNQMAYAIRSYNSAIMSGELSHDGHAAFTRHIGNCCRRMLTLRDDQGVPLWTIYKERPDSPHKIDLAMAGALSWEARRDALASGIGKESVYETRGVLTIG